MRRHHAFLSGSRQLVPLWGLALLGLFLLPMDYRAGADTAHAHSLVQLWGDATDGVIHHHDHGALTTPHHERTGSHGYPEEQTDPDIGDRQDSVPTTSGIAMLLVAMILVPVVVRTPAALSGLSHRPPGFYPPVPLPPPRRARQSLHRSFPQATTRVQAWITRGRTVTV